MLDYLLLDVFTRNPLEGNQLAVFLDGRALSGEEMQRIAKETNLSETTFILPEQGKNGAHRVRIFTVDEELPFAGHPTLGTAAALRTIHGDPSEIVLDLNVGPVPVRFEMRDGAAFGEMTQVDPTFGQVHDPAAVAEAAGLDRSSISNDATIQTVSTGMPFAIVLLNSVDALKTMHFDWRRASQYLASTDAKFLYFLARDPARANTFETRMIFYTGEDPATGSAAGCCISWCVKHGVV
ncbi:MAG TPA: PhzF family phenazine biosynthesis protein, partial [Terriglobales bacterium]